MALRLNQSVTEVATQSTIVEKVLEKVGSEKVIVFESCPESVLDEV